MLCALDILSLGRRLEPFYMLNSSFEKVLWRYLFEMEWTILNCFYGCLCSHLLIESNLSLLACLDLDPVSWLVCLDQFIWYIGTCPFCLAAYKVFLWEPLELYNTLCLLILAAKSGFSFLGKHVWCTHSSLQWNGCIWNLSVVCYICFSAVTTTSSAINILYGHVLVVSLLFYHPT